MLKQKEIKIETNKNIQPIKIGFIIDTTGKYHSKNVGVIYYFNTEKVIEVINEFNCLCEELLKI